MGTKIKAGQKTKYGGSKIKSGTVKPKRKSSGLTGQAGKAAGNIRKSANRAKKI